MGGLLLILLAALAVVAVLDALAVRFGVDSRPEFDDSRAPAPGIYT